jgi:undecaprenyl diphosphate synthase
MSDRSSGRSSGRPRGRPRHVAIIMDGNARWARARGLDVTEGHRAGTDALKRAIQLAGELEIAQLTVYAFSTENWARPPQEVTGLMSLFLERIRREAEEMDKEGVRLRFIGRRDRIAPAVAEEIDWAEQLTARHRSLTVFVGFDYGARAEILHAAERYAGGGEEEFRRHMYAPEMEDPELIIRTGGELRLSNFLLWQAAYAELWFSECLWPDFDKPELEEALDAYAEREYRFGGR